MPEGRNEYDRAAIALTALTFVFNAVWTGLGGGAFCWYKISSREEWIQNCRPVFLSAYVLGPFALLFAIIATPLQFKAFQLYYKEKPNAPTKRDLCVVAWVFYGLMIGCGLAGLVLMYFSPKATGLVAAYFACWLIEFPCMFAYCNAMYRSPAMHNVVVATETVTEYLDGTRRSRRQVVNPDGSRTTTVTVTELQLNPDGTRTTTITETQIGVLVDAPLPGGRLAAGSDGKPDGIELSATHDADDDSLSRVA